MIIKLGPKDSAKNKYFTEDGTPTVLHIRALKIIKIGNGTKTSKSACCNPRLYPSQIRFSVSNTEMFQGFVGQDVSLV